MGDGLQDEGGEGRVDDRVVHPGLHQPLGLPLVVQPVVTHSQHPVNSKVKMFKKL